MSDTAQSLTLVLRVVAEHRRRVYTLLAGLVANLIIFGAVVYPLQSDVANVEQRTRTSEQALAAARAEHAQASGTLTGKDRAVKELDTFYTRVLAADLSGARRLTFARLARLAAQSKLEFDRRKYEAVVERGSSLTRLKVNMELSGDYGNVRQFIHEIETAPEFVVIDKVGLSERGESDAPLRLTLELSTYYRNAQP